MKTLASFLNEDREELRPSCLAVPMFKQKAISPDFAMRGIGNTFTLFKGRDTVFAGQQATQLNYFNGTVDVSIKGDVVVHDADEFDKFVKTCDAKVAAVRSVASLKFKPNNTYWFSIMV